MTTFKRFDRDKSKVLDTLLVDGAQDKHRGVGYHVGEPLSHAINTALALGKPLLVSGEPGCGKTELGFAIARNLAVRHLQFFPVKSDSEAQRLFYDFDTLRRFHVAQSGSKTKEAVDPRNFIRYRGLGRAILDALPASETSELRPRGSEVLADPVRSVVIIDEIDKAPRDFSNDLLNEIDQLWFRVPGLAGWAKMPETPRNLIAPELRPDAFLRRCVFHHIEHPSDVALQRRIILGHLTRAKASLPEKDVQSAIELVVWARSQSMDRSPGLSELIEFALALSVRSQELSGQPFEVRAQRCSAALGKSVRDQRLLHQYLAQKSS
jgi:MoxR-like ATPase